MDFQNIFPFWGQLNQEEQKTVAENVLSQKLQKGDILHRGCGECSGIVHVAKGQLRVYIVSEEGREVTLYRLHQGEMCVLSASFCMINLKHKSVGRAGDWSRWPTPAVFVIRKNETAEKTGKDFSVYEDFVLALSDRVAPCWLVYELYELFVLWA